MISKLTGTISRVGLQSIFVDLKFIEYEVYVPLNVLEYFQNHSLKNKKYEVYIFHHFQGEEQKLYGFLDFSQRELFRTLIKLKGIGPSLALSILSHINTEELLKICEEEDAKRLTKIPKIGNQTAEEIIFEVNRKKKLFLKLLEHTDHKKTVKTLSEDFFDDVIQGLKYLGYKEKAIIDTIHKIKQSKKVVPQNVSEWIREVLKEI